MREFVGFAVEIKARKVLLVNLVLVALLVLAGGVFVFAQVTSGIEGRAEDTSGAAIQGATVTVTDLETGTVRTAQTDDGGNYRVVALPVGRYEVKTEKEGFATTVQTGISLVVGQQAVVNVTLEVGAVNQEVQVKADSQLVNTTTASTSGLVSETQVKELPLNGRSYDNLLTLNPTIVNMTSIGTAGSAPASNMGNIYSVVGRRAYENLLLLNGIEYAGSNLGPNTVNPGGASRQLLGIDAVREFNVVTDTYGAEYGKRVGGQISVVTQSGTNQLHGTLYEFLRNSVLDARNYFDHPAGRRTPPFQRNQFGAALGGPIIKDKLFIFGNYEGFRQRLGLSNVTFVPDDNARKGLLPCTGGSGTTIPCAAGTTTGTPTLVPNFSPGMLKYMPFWPEPNGPDLGGGVAENLNNPKQSVNEDFGTARVDYNFSSKDMLSGVYTIDDSLNVTPNNDPLFATNTYLRNQVLSVQETHTFSPSLLNVFTAGGSHLWVTFCVNPFDTSFPSDLDFVDGAGPRSISIGAGVGGTGGGNSQVIAGTGSVIGSINSNAKTLITLEDSVYVSEGRHQLSAGVWFQRERSNEYLTSVGAAVFPSLVNFLQGNVSSFSVASREVPLYWRQWEGAWYVQDNIRVSPRLSVRLGLRQEFTNGWNEADGNAANWLFNSSGVLNTNPIVGTSVFTENNAKWLFSPRIGLAWDVFGDGQTAVRAGFGTYYDLNDNLDFAFGAPPSETGSALYTNQALLPLLPINPSTPLEPLCGPGVPQPCITPPPKAVQSNLKTPTIEEWNLSLEHQITPTMALRIGYVGSHGFHELLELDANSILPQICSDPAGCVAGGVNGAKSTVSEGTTYIPVGKRPNPYLSAGPSVFSLGTSSYNGLLVDVTKRLSHGLQLRANYTWSKSLDIMSSALSTVNTASTVLDPTNLRLNWGPSAFNATNQATSVAVTICPSGTARLF